MHIMRYWPIEVKDSFHDAATDCYYGLMVCSIIWYYFRTWQLR